MLFRSQRLEALRTDTRKKEWLASRVLLASLNGEEQTVQYKSTGAPFLKDSSVPLSISHTKGYVAVQLYELGAAGIDIEYRSDRVKKIRSRFMSEVEDATICSTNDADQLLLYWCAKETLFKLIDQQDVDFIRHLHVKPFTLEQAGKIEVYETRTPQQHAFTLGYRVEEEFVITYRL